MAPKSNLVAPTSASKMTRSGSKVATNGVAKRPAPAPKSAVPSVKADNRKGVRISARKKTSSKVSSAEAAAQTSPVLVTSPMQLVQLNSQLRQASGDNAAVSDPSQIAQKRLFAVGLKLPPNLLLRCGKSRCGEGHKYPAGTQAGVDGGA